MSDVPVGYKQTEVGVIPEDWEVVKAKDIFTKIQDGTHFSPNVRGGEYLYVTSKNIKFGWLKLSTAEYIDEIQHKSIYKRCDVKKGDILLTKDGANTGNAALNTLDEEFSLLSSVAFLRVNHAEHSSGFYLQQLLSASFQAKMQGEMSGNAITRLTLEKINNFNFAVPSYKEQTAIANALSDVDALIAALEKLINKKTAIKTAAMQQLLTGKKRLPPFDQLNSGYKQTELGEIPKDWGVVKLGSVLLEFKNGYGFSANGYCTDGTPIITMAQIGLSGNFQYDEKKVNRWKIADFYKLKDFWVIDGDLLIAMTDVTPEKNLIGQMAIVKLRNTALLNQRVGLLRFNSQKADSKYLSFYSCLPIWKTYCKGVASLGVQANIGTSDIQKALIILPPHDEQTAIANVLSNMDTELNALQQRLAKTQQLKQGMMQELLTGKTRLVAVKFPSSEGLGVG